MRKIYLFLVTFLSVIIGSNAQAQTDEIYKHNGDIIKGTVQKVDEFTITFSYVNETSQNTISKYAVAKIIYGQSGRVENVTEKITLNGAKDWEKVIVLEDKTYIAGLKRVNEIRGKTAFINFQTGNTGDKKALKKLKEEAAKQNCPFILITSDKATVGAESNYIGGSQNIKTGIAYSY